MKKVRAHKFNAISKSITQTIVASVADATHHEEASASGDVYSSGGAAWVPEASAFPTKSRRCCVGAAVSTMLCATSSTSSHAMRYTHKRGVIN